MREVEGSLRQADQFHRVGRSRRHDERHRVGHADVLAGEDRQPASDETWILAYLEQSGEPIHTGVRVGAAHALDQCRDEVVVLLGAVAEGPHRARLNDMGRLDERGGRGRGRGRSFIASGARTAGSAGESNRHLDHGDRHAGVAGRQISYERQRFVGHFGRFRPSSPPGDLADLLLGQGLKTPQRRTTEQRRVQGEERVLRRGTNEDHDTILHTVE